MTDRLQELRERFQSHFRGFISEEHLIDLLTDCAQVMTLGPVQVAKIHAERTKNIAQVIPDLIDLVFALSLEIYGEKEMERIEKMTPEQLQAELTADGYTEEKLAERLKRLKEQLAAHAAHD